MKDQTTLSDISEHVRACQAAAQAELDALFSRRRSMAFGSSEERWNSLQIEKAHGKVLALASICGYLEARTIVDQINAHYSVGA